MRRLWVLAYDVADARRLSRVARLCEGYGERVQESVFEMALGNRERRQMLTAVRAEIDPEKDSVRCYPVCEACRARIEWQGRGEVPGGQPYWLV